MRVLYAGSLVALVENDLGPAFAKTSGITVQGRPGGSVALAHMILAGLQAPDVFVSADPGVNRLLMRSGPGPSASWFLTFARMTARTDPRLDPKGYRTILLLGLAERYYRRPGLETRLLGDPENPAQTFPEEALVGRLESGQLDAGFF